MRFMLTIPVTKLSRALLLDEHRSIHAYFGGMEKNFEKWSKHPNFRDVSPLVLYHRHEQIVLEMIERGWNLQTPVSLERAIILKARKESELK